MMKVRVGQILPEHSRDVKEAKEVRAVRMRVVRTFWHCGEAGDVRPHPYCGDDSTLLLTYGEQAGEDPEGRNEKTEMKMPFLCNLYFTYAKLFI